MTRPSDPILKWIRAQISQRGENTASVAKRLNRSRQEFRRILSGADPMTLDDLVAITEGMEISPSDFGFGEALVPVDDVDDQPEPSHWENQPEALVRMAFDRGMDVLLVCKAEALRGVWDGPDAILERYAEHGVPLTFDAAYHRYMDPEFGPDNLVVSVGFDKLYRCTIPWHAMERITFTPLTPVISTPVAPSRPVLTLVK